MRSILLIWLSLILKAYCTDETNDLPIISTDNFHGDYKGSIDDEIWKQDINDTLKEHHLHSPLAITPTLSEYKRLVAPYETDSTNVKLKSTNNIDDWVNISDGEAFKSHNMRYREASQSGHEKHNKSVYETSNLSVGRMKDGSFANSSINQTAEIPIKEDVAVGLKFNGKYYIASVIFFLSFLT